MNGIGVFLMLGLLLACVVVFTYWLRSPHPIDLRWNASVDRGLERIDPRLLQD